MERNERKRFLLRIPLKALSAIIVISLILTSCRGSIVTNGYFTEDTLIISDIIHKSKYEKVLFLDKIGETPTKGIFHYTNVELSGDNYNIGDTVQLKVVKIKKETH